MTLTISADETRELITKAVERGFELYQDGRMEEADGFFRQVLEIEPDNIVALQMAGLVGSRIPGAAAEAVGFLMRALDLDEANADVHNNMGLVYSWSDAKNLPRAEYHYRRAIELRPEALHFYSNLGLLLKSQGKYDETEAIMKEALALDGASHFLHFNFATFLGERRRWDEARSEYEKAIELAPDFPAPHYNYSNLLLMHGEYERGWAEYEWRWETYPQFKHLKDRFTEDQAWDGKADLAGKTVLIFAEQGIGDTIQFCRFLCELKALGATTLVEEHDFLLPTLETCEWVDQTVKIGDPLPPFDYHCSVMSLCHLLKRSTPSLMMPAKIPYLGVNREKLPDYSINDEASWDAYKGMHKVGIVWAGNPVHRNDPIRSCRLTNFKALQNDKVKLFSLQKDVRPRFWPGLGVHDLAEGAEGMGVVDLKDFQSDFNCTAALIARMDLVVAVDTATAHLAAAMGKPTWLLVAQANDWRWGPAGTRTHWYPTMRVLRQTTLGDWDTVFNRAGEWLAEAVRSDDFAAACLTQDEEGR